ncbi:hypothetical protein B0O99DRAFT_603102 [Bisporella sp. PMI_857]|nr:hypothetical protein B0O99DRAFT_603102 [Bisporella sp. PMI_857]
MVALLSLVLYSLGLLQALVAGSPVPHAVVPHYFQTNPITPRNLTAATLQNELGPLLSIGTLIFGPDSPDWANATDRWNKYTVPDIQVVVVPAEESDISKIAQVKYCNQNSIEFLARNRGHGLSTSLNSFKGLEINLDSLGAITIQEGGETAILQGGTYAGEVIETLYAQGYVTPTGSTACVGVLGPTLGGGHGRYEGLYGLILDTIVHFNVVLADGSEVGVNETSHEDLFWALKGAGHNFGIVTSVVKKIYPKGADTWHTHAYIWAQDKLETVFEALNEFHTSDNGTTPPLMGASYGAIIINSSISETEAILSFGFNYAGPAEDAEKLLAPFNAIEAIWEGADDVTYPELSGISQDTCAGAQYALSSTMTLKYNATAQRLLYNHFNEKAALYPELAVTALLWHEGYATAGLQAVDPYSTAYAHREENHLMLFDVAVPVGSNLSEAATIWAKEAQEIWNAGQPDRQPAIYVNYASGNEWETLESIYGYEEWRLKKLRHLKAKYDPHNRFRYYVPIIAHN